MQVTLAVAYAVCCVAAPGAAGTAMCMLLAAVASLAPYAA